MAGGAGSMLGKGGMLTKILAAQRAARSGASTVIASGREPGVLTRLAAGEAVGTALIATPASLGARKQWLADHVRLAGKLQLDAGAVAIIFLNRYGSNPSPFQITDCPTGITPGIDAQSWSKKMP